MITRALFGILPGGQKVELFTLSTTSTGRAGAVVPIEMCVCDLGGTIVSLRTPDRQGVLADIVLGCDSLEGYLAQPAYLGAIVGRFANRIADARFRLDGREYGLPANDHGQHLHGGARGFDKRCWTVEPFDRAGAEGLRLSLVSPDGDEGYPGTLRVVVDYALTSEGALEIDYRADTDAPTPVNLSQHAYFNLAGHDSGDILGHHLQLHASAFTPVDARLIPTGELRDVAGTAFDFREAHAIGAQLEADDPQLERGFGYDHNFVVDGPAGTVRPAADLFEPVSGRTLSVATTAPGVQLYTGNFLDGTIVGKGGCHYGPRAGLCLETQHFPDAPNQPAFPSAIVRPEAPYRSRTVFRFGTRG